MGFVGLVRKRLFNINREGDAMLKFVMGMVVGLFCSVGFAQDFNSNEAGQVTIPGYTPPGGNPNPPVTNKGRGIPQPQNISPNIQLKETPQVTNPPENNPPIAVPENQQTQIPTVVGPRSGDAQVPAANVPPSRQNGPSQMPPQGQPQPGVTQPGGAAGPSNESVQQKSGGYY